ncbi:MAG: CinA family protein [Gammaproteobacteria bacterium]
MNLADRAQAATTLLLQRGETIAVSESSTGGLVSAALLAVPGASAYYLGGAVIYTAASRQALLGLPADLPAAVRSASEPYAALCAQIIRERHGATWGLAETGATGPSGNRYGDRAGHCCIAIAGPVQTTVTLDTGVSDREANMHAFAQSALELLGKTLAGAPRSG